ncbi:hypothetical protein ACOSQ3_018797 [Xanthoceras sorbifolium]
MVVFWRRPTNLLISTKTVEADQRSLLFNQHAEKSASSLLARTALAEQSGKPISFWDDVWPCHPPLRCMP